MKCALKGAPEPLSFKEEVVCVCTCMYLCVCVASLIYYTSSKITAKLLGFPGGSSGKEPACQCKRCNRCGFDPWAGKIPGRREWLPTPVFLPGESHGPAGSTHSSTRGLRPPEQLERPAGFPSSPFSHSPAPGTPFCHLSGCWRQCCLWI